eukprot:TRINITY_DN103080_c0_g1_i1.p1 TRINITY_DN103080_c0_g1~~TRINITY_DN103080_c0_g1_i1.p1  ORF type:complete len:387 (-),score=-41.34 TRINITY_DN103080_c0_g1_i1:56-1216(-)
MGSCISIENTRQKRFKEVVSKFPTGSVTHLRGDAGGLPQMCTGRISATNGILTSPVSGSPCVAYFYEISEYRFTGNIFSNCGWGFKKLYSEKHNIDYEVYDPKCPDVKVLVSASEVISDNTSRRSNKKNVVGVEYFTDVALAHVCPNPSHDYDVPDVIGGDIHATENLIRGYPLKFGMLDGEGTNTRIEVPESIEQLLNTKNISRLGEKGWWAKLKEAIGRPQEDPFRTFAITEMCIRVDDQVNVIATFQNDSNNVNIKKAYPVTRTLKTGEGDKEKAWSAETRNVIFKLTPEDDAILITKFPKVGVIEHLPRSLIWSQEQGVFNNFALEHEVNQNVKKLDYRSGLSPSKKSQLSSPVVGTKEARAYLYSDSAKQRLGLTDSDKNA